MKRLLIPVVAIGLLAGIPVPASATENHGLQIAQNDQQHRQGGGADRDRRGQGGAQQGQPRGGPVQGGGPNPFMNQNQNRFWDQGQNRNRLQRQDRDRDRFRDRRRFDWNLYRPGQRPPAWERHRHFDRGFYERNFRAERRFHYNRYIRPHGWYYRRWSYGQFLPFIFWSREYWLTDYWTFGLMDPPYGYVWVRYGNDALLINVETGMVLRVIYGLFY